MADDGHFMLSFDMHQLTDIEYTIHVRYKKLFMGSLFHQKLESSIIAGNKNFNYKAQSRLEKLLLH